MHQTALPDLAIILFSVEVASRPPRRLWFAMPQTQRVTLESMILRPSLGPAGPCTVAIAVP
jgi:hypothetical protein